MRHAFDAALEAAARAEPDPPPRPPPAFAVLVAEFAATSAPAPTDGHSLWELAAAWTPEADPSPEPPPAPRPSVLPENIAAELELFALKSAVEIARARRRFMWENHPDRCAESDRDLANRRVAIANMLLDRMLALVLRRRARPQSPRP